jgi:hypothetical protein
MNLLSRLLIAFAICLIAIPMLASPVQATGETISLYPSSGYVGDEVYISGENFAQGNYWVYYEKDGSWVEVLDRYDCDVDSDGDFSTDEFSIPESCSGKHEIRVCNYHSSSTSCRVAYADFTVKPKVEVTSPTTAKGHVGDTIKVKGTGFGGEERYIKVWYYLDSTHHTDFAVSGRASAYGTWETTFKVPDSVKGSHKIDADGEDNDYTDVKDCSFEVEPKIEMIKPADAKGTVGTEVEVKGTGFGKDEADIKITFAGNEVTQTSPADTDEYGTWTAKFEVPPSPKGSHKIDARGRYTTYTEIDELSFEIGLTIELTPAEGHMGTDISVSGSGFAAGKSITITYQGETYSSTTDTKGSFPAVAFKAKGEHGEQLITVTDGAGNTLTATFVMESTAPPKPTLSSPANGTRIGFIGSQTATFQWTAVTDPSGVSYKLQIASDPSFVSLVVPEISGLTEASYTLPQEQALPYGTYYWRVKAIDGAQNDSGWTTAYSLQSGLLPTWAFIVIIVVIVALIAALLYLFILRRR